MKTTKTNVLLTIVLLLLSFQEFSQVTISFVEEHLFAQWYLIDEPENKIQFSESIMTHKILGYQDQQVEYSLVDTSCDDILNEYNFVFIKTIEDGQEYCIEVSNINDERMTLMSHNSGKFFYYCKVL